MSPLFLIKHFEADFTGNLGKQNAYKEHLLPEDNLGDPMANNHISLADDPTWLENGKLVGGSVKFSTTRSRSFTLQRPTSSRQELDNPQESKGMPRLADYGQLGPRI